MLIEFSDFKANLYRMNIVCERGIGPQGNLKKIIEESEARFRLLQDTVSLKKEAGKLEGATLSRKENLPRSEMNAGLPLHFLLLLKKSTNGFFSVLMVTPLRSLSKGLNKLVT